MKNCATCDYFVKTKDKDKDIHGNPAQKIGYCDYPVPKSVKKEKINIFHNKMVYINNEVVTECLFWRKIFT